MNPTPTRILAIDWSGDQSLGGQRRKIWIADWNAGALTLTSGRTRDEVCDYLIAAAKQTPKLVAGLDFAFSYPAWFLREQGCETASQFWEFVANGKGEEWLSACRPPLWGRPGSRCPTDHRAPDWRGFRQTDRALNIDGIQPKSPFQIGGAGAVGTGSLRGIPILPRLRQAGFRVWPFTAPGFPVALEIYPRLFTGPGNKSSPAFRAGYLAAAQYSALPEEILAKARGSEDAFDALCSAMAMSGHPVELAELKQATDANTLLEGRIWSPEKKIHHRDAEFAEGHSRSL